jgi:hypothetical protein
MARGRPRARDHLLDTLSRLLALSRRELAVLVAAFVLSLPAVTPRIYASDEIQYYSYLRSLWFDGDVSFENEYRYFFDRNVGRGEGFHATFLEPYTDAGRRPSFATIGCALLWSPFYAVADLVTRVRGGPPDGFSRPYVAAVAYGSAFYGFVAILLSIGAARRLAGPGLLAGILIWLGTPLLFYMYVSPPYSHACSAFAVALFVTIWLHARERWTVGGAIALGLSGALMAMVREQDAFLALGPAVDFVATAFLNRDGSLSITRSSRGPTPARGRLAPSAFAEASADRRSLGGGWSRSPAAAGAADTAIRINQGRPGTTSVARAILVAATGCFAFALGLLPQLFAYKALNGHFGPSRLVTRKMNWQAPHAIEVLASPEHGFFLWTPLAALTLAGLVVLAVRGQPPARRVAWCALLMVAVQIYVSGSVESWTVAGAFGQRRFVALTIVLTIGLAALIAAVPRGVARPALALTLGLCVWWNVALIAEFGTGLMNRQRLELRKNAYDAFVTLPQQLPGLAQRYFLDRNSFYRQKEE